MAVTRLALFDFDGTLTRRDTLWPFLLHARGPWRLAGALLLTAGSLARAALGRLPGGVAKERLFARLFRGMPAAEFARLGRSFRAERFARPEAAAAIAALRARGLTVAVVSASVSEWVGPAARALGADEVIATEAEAGPDGRLTGRFRGPNCIGTEKVRRVRERFPGASVAHAFGDSPADRPMLAMAENPHWKTLG